MSIAQDAVVIDTNGIVLLSDDATIYGNTNFPVIRLRKAGDVLANWKQALGLYNYALGIVNWRATQFISQHSSGSTHSYASVSAEAADDESTQVDIHAQTGGANGGWILVTSAGIITIGGDGTKQNKSQLQADRIKALDGVVNETKAGIPVDGDFNVAAEDGLLVVDTTNNRLYVRSGGAWKYAALT